MPVMTSSRSSAVSAARWIGKLPAHTLISAAVVVALTGATTLLVAVVASSA